MKKILVLLSIIVTPYFYSQKHTLGKVTIEELSEKRHPTDSSAVAAILFETGEVKFEFSQTVGFEIVTTVKAKIKIYKKDGYEWANKSINYYVGSNNFREKVAFSDAVSYNLVNGKIEKTKLKSEGEFTEKVNKFWNRKKISMPNVREGSIIEYEYKFYSTNFGSIDEWKFQTSIPVNFSEYKTIIPEYYVYKENSKGYLFPKIVKEMTSRTYQITTKQRYLNSGTEFQNENTDIKEDNTTYTLKNVPALKSEDYVNNINNYTSSISHELTMTRYPGEPFKTYSVDWESVVKTIYDNEDFGNELNKTGYFEDDVKNLLSGITSQKEKIATLFNFVKSNVKWNEFYGYSCNDGVKNAYKMNSGNVAEINLMLTAMLRSQGIEASPVLISTRSNGVSFYPNRTAFNYVICGIEMQNEIVLLDATDKNAIPNLLPIRDLNWIGRIIRKNGSSAQVNLMPKIISNDLTIMMATIAADGTVSGKIREQHFDYNGYVYRSRYGDLTKESYLEYLEKKLNNSEVEEYDVAGRKELSEPIVENYGFKNNNSVEIIGDKMYFSPLLFFASVENPFKQEVREYPIDFIYPNQDRYLVTLTIPEGYSVESLPKSSSIPMSDNLINVKYIISNAGNKIQLSYNIDTNTSIISSEYYDELKAVYSEIVKKENEKIVLKKI